MKKNVYAFLMCFGLTVLLSACKPMSDQETVTTETMTITEREKPTSEEFTDYGEKIITFKISGKACKKWFGYTTADLTEFFNTGTSWVLEDDFINVNDKNSYVELKMSESDIKTCKNKMFGRIGIKPSDSLQGDSFFYYNDKYNKIRAFVRVDERFGKLYEIGMVEKCLMILQMLDGVDSDEWRVDTTIINPDTGNVVKEMQWGESDESQEYIFNAEDCK